MRKVHLNLGGYLACGVNAEVFSQPAAEWLAVHPAHRCGRCEMSEAGQDLLLGQWKKSDQPPESEGESR